YEGRIEVWNPTDGTIISDQQVSPASVGTRLEFGPDRDVVSVLRGSCRIARWDPRNPLSGGGVLSFPEAMELAKELDVAISPDGRNVAMVGPETKPDAGSDRSPLTLVTLVDGRAVDSHVVDPKGGLWDHEFSSDGRLLIVRSEPVSIWRLNRNAAKTDVELV